jgi:hypothetical protein
MLDKVLAIVSILFLIASVGVVVWFVPEPDLMIISIIVLVMAVSDFYLLTFRKKNSDDGSPTG